MIKLDEFLAEISKYQFDTSDCDIVEDADEIEQQQLLNEIVEIAKRLDIGPVQPCEESAKIINDVLVNCVTEPKIVPTWKVNNEVLLDFHIMLMKARRFDELEKIFDKPLNDCRPSEEDCKSLGE